MLADRATLDRFRAGDRATLASVYRAFAPEIAKLVSYGFSFRAGDEVHRFFGYRHRRRRCRRRADPPLSGRARCAVS